MAEANQAHPIDFCTFAMFIIDEIHYPPPKPPVKDIVGGGGSYAALGARLFSPPPQSSTVGWIVDVGSDFPPEVFAQIERWQTSCLFRKDTTRLTTRGWNGYDAHQNRAFKYTTPKLRIDTESLPAHLLMSKSFHMVCSPQRCISLVTTLNTARRKLSRQAPKPIIIWEPVPDLCTPDELINLTHALSHVTICSPNHRELGSLMGATGILADGSVDRDFVERACEQLLESMPVTSYGLIIRSGAAGCYICKPPTSIRHATDPTTGSGSAHSTLRTPKPRSTPRHGHGGLSMASPAAVDFEALFAGKDWSRKFGDAADEEPGSAGGGVMHVGGVERWVPAYHGGDARAQAKVRDPTGGGNAFLGAVAVAMARGEGIEDAALWGAVAASFAIEQVGMPVVEGCGEKERWNGERVAERLRSMRPRP